MKQRAGPLKAEQIVEEKDVGGGLGEDLQVYRNNRGMRCVASAVDSYSIVLVVLEANHPLEACMETGLEIGIV